MRTALRHMAVRNLTATQWVYLSVHALLCLIGFLVLRSSDTALAAVGASLVAAGIVGLVVFAYVQMNDQLRVRIDATLQAGIVKAFPARAAQIKTEYDTRLAVAHRQIDLMGFGLKAFREDFREDRLAELANRVESVRILLLDPESPSVAGSYAKQRDKEEGNRTGQIEGDIRAFVSQYASLILDGRIQVRLYECLPSINVFRIDNVLFWGPYLVKEQSRNTPTLLVADGGYLFEPITEHFGRIWTDLSRPVPESWLKS